jgi:hypothetical protein
MLFIIFAMAVCSLGGGEGSLPFELLGVGRPCPFCELVDAAVGAEEGKLAE